MITEFGKFARKLRVDNDEYMQDMAEKLNVTASYLSAVENGKRKLPDSWPSLITEKYVLNSTQLYELQKITLLSHYSEREINAINAALSVIHLNDRSNYINGLWDVLRALLGTSIVDNNAFSTSEFTKLFNTFNDSLTTKNS